MGIVISKGGKFAGRAPITVNGRLYRLPVGEEIEATDDVKEALRLAGIDFTDAIANPVESGLIILPGNGTRISVTVNGKLTYLTTDKPISVDDDVRAALNASNIAFIKELIAGGGGGGSAVIPNLQPPGFDGVAIEGTKIFIDVGVWNGAVSFKGEIRDTLNNVIVPFQDLTSDQETSLTGLGGKTIIATITPYDAQGRAGDPVSTAPFGPILAASNEFIGSFAWPSAPQTYTSASYPVTEVVLTGGLIEPEDTYSSARGFGFGGTTLSGTVTRGRSAADERLTTSLQNNNFISVTHFGVKLPPGTYIVYAGAAGHTTVPVNVGIWESDGTNFNSLSSAVSSRDLSSVEVMDATGVIYPNAAAWRAASPANEPGGGLGREVTLTAGNDRLVFGRASTVTTAASRLCTVTILRKL